MEGSDGEAAGSDLPWASVFDPAANLRALSAIQADGFRAASELVDRFVRMAATGIDGTAPATPAAGSPAGQQGDLFGATGLEPFVMSWWSMVEQFGRAAAGGAAPHHDSATIDVSTGAARGRLSLHATPPDAASGVVWLHNGGSVDVAKVRLRCGDLLAHDGAVIPSHRVRFDPDVLGLPALSSRGVTVEVDVGDAVAPGSYRGTLLAEGYPDLWLAFELAVAAPAP